MGGGGLYCVFSLMEFNPKQGLRTSVQSRRVAEKLCRNKKKQRMKGGEKNEGQQEDYNCPLFVTWHHLGAVN